MNKARLLKLATELERCSRGRVLSIPGDGKAGFDMGVVVVTAEPDRWCGGNAHGCGTAACAMGFAGLHPWFQKRGLKWSRGLNRLTVNRRGMRFEAAACKFFDIDDDDATALFNPDSGDETPKQVAKRIRQFVASQA